MKLFNDEFMSKWLGITSATLRAFMCFLAIGNYLNKFGFLEGMKILSVVGTRPNFIKSAALIEEIKKHSEVDHTLIHTGQHYDEKMSNLFFNELEIPKPDINLGIGSSTHERTNYSFFHHNADQC